jgi:hypothetical protein
MLLGAVAASVMAVAVGSFVVAGGRARAPAQASPGASDPRIVAHAVGGGATVVVSGAREPLVEGAALGAGSRIVTPSGGRAALSFATGTSIDLGEGADLTIGAEPSSQVLRLVSGFADLRVAKLSPGQRFVVATPDAEIEVRGTQFRVAVTPPDPRCGGGTRTRVTVAEGVVSVRHDGVEASVGAGSQWPRECPGPAEAAAEPAHLVLAGSGHSPPVRPSAVSALTEQNNLFAEAAAAKRRGDLQAALSSLSRLLSKYPGSALAESAYAERMRLLRATNPSLGADAAKEYLARYPQGFAKAQAEAIASEQP